MLEKIDQVDVRGLKLNIIVHMLDVRGLRLDIIDNMLHVRGLRHLATLENNIT